MIIPNDNRLYKDGLYYKIKANQQIFVTPYDIYNTLLHIAFGENTHEYKQNSTQYGSSLLTKINYKQRYCDSPFLDFQINLFNCRCNKKK